MSGGSGQGIGRRAVVAGMALGATALSTAPARALTAGRAKAPAAGTGARPGRTPAAVTRWRTASGHTVLARPLANPDGSNPLVEIWDVNRHGHVLGMIDAGEGTTPQWPSAIWADGRVTVLPPPVADAADCGARHLNDSDQAAGYYTVGGRTHATLWTGGVPRVLDIGTVYSEATALNNLGQVAVFGYDVPSGDTATPSKACLVDGTTVTTIAPPPARQGITFSAVAVNDRGEALMRGYIPQSPMRLAYLWRDGTTVADFTDIDGTWSLMGVAGLNSRGDVVGDYSSQSGPPTTRAFLWSGGTLTTFTGPHNGTASVSDYSIQRALNDLGDVVGFSNSAVGQRPFLRSGGTATDLGTLGGTSARAVGVNNARQVAGGSSLANGSWSAFLWRAGEMIAITPPPGYAGTGASAITEQGDVLGWATTVDGTRTDYFRWTVL
ncbi:hypothetical protein [Streptomyces sp. HPF1205]|uniref:hypothetical protein n=1 Tax=Streptomyces sp. HPF1205 TaxID=2873262 RepID=UPI001CEDE9AA|nr:hypothetical protein [Streptomyces sp. HPF1205]